MDSEIRSGKRNSGSVLFGLTVSFFAFGAAAQTEGESPIINAQPYPVGLTPNSFYRVVSEVNPAMGRLVTIEEFRRTGFNFELCNPEGKLTNIDLLSEYLDVVEEDCAGNPVNHFRAPNIEQMWSGAVLVDAFYREVGVVSSTASTHPMFGVGVAYGVQLDAEAIRSFYGEVEASSVLSQQWTISPSQESVFTVYGADGRPQIIVPAASAEGLTDVLIPLRTEF